MFYVAVASGFISRIGYDPTTRKCEVTFSESGESYAYKDVEPADAAILTFGKDKGSFFNREFKAKYRGYEVVSTLPRSG